MVGLPNSMAAGGSESRESDATAVYRPQVGERHPDFTLPSIADRAPVALSQYRGKKVLLIHFASW